MSLFGFSIRIMLASWNELGGITFASIFWNIWWRIGIIFSYFLTHDSVDSVQHIPILLETQFVSLCGWHLVLDFTEQSD